MCLVVISLRRLDLLSGSVWGQCNCLSAEVSWKWGSTVSLALFSAQVSLQDGAHRCLDSLVRFTRLSRLGVSCSSK